MRLFNKKHQKPRVSYEERHDYTGVHYVRHDPMELARRLFRVPPT